ncbi:hypothetical protein BKA65DRAFT_561091 [Rhexocercosporidium sp. MPI-PUGE-AT-0058]|nr:hypothetical protein BKA65DRAFT_561091 [Rhexocercosporidium sp. MPI-PUGE-AT-0058]
MEDAVRPTTKAFKAMYERGFLTWYNLYSLTLLETEESHLFWDTLLQSKNTLLSHPSFLPDLALDKSFSNTILARGISTWRTTTTEQLPCDPPSFNQDFCVQVAEDCPVILELSNSRFGSEFLDLLQERDGRQEGEGDHIAILILAWTYILSARWAELIPGVNGVKYSACQARWANEAILSEKMLVDLGDIDDGAARWWEAVLATEGGWSANTLSDKGHVLYSPWYMKVVSERPFILLCSSGSPLGLEQCSAASFTAALAYLYSYVEYHDVAGQSQAALAATLLLPVARFENRRILLPIHRSPQTPQRGTKTIQKSPMCCKDPKQIDNLLTLSCNAIGIKSLLNSIFFESGVESNICGAWLQGTFEFLDSNLLQDGHLLFQVLVKRDPALAFLWLGAFITGAQNRALREARQGWWKIDLNVAAWTRTLVSFVQEPVADLRLEAGFGFVPGFGEEEISRADECRLLYLAHEKGYTTPPIFPFAPFGRAALQDTNIEVRRHAKCEARHGLEVESLTWRRRDSQVSTSISPGIPLRAKNGVPRKGDLAITYENLDYEDDDCSEMVTRNIFTWLRDEDGFPVAEKAIREHEWIDNLDDDDDCLITGDTRSTVGGDLHGWLRKTATWRSNSL